MTFATTETAPCNYCEGVVDKGDAVYDDRTSAHYCDIDCFYGWASGNPEEVTDFYERLNITGG